MNHKSLIKYFITGLLIIISQLCLKNSCTTNGKYASIYKSKKVAIVKKANRRPEEELLQSSRTAHLLLGTRRTVQFGKPDAASFLNHNVESGITFTTWQINNRALFASNTFIFYPFHAFW